MPRLVDILLLGCLITGASCLVQFINPPPFGKVGDFRENPTYVTGSTVNVAWTNGEEGKGVSIMLYQLNETNGQWFGDMEYLTQGATGVTTYSWLVGTRMDLSISNLFYLDIYQEGKGVSDSNSHYFNIEAQDAAAPSASFSSESASSISSATSVSSTTNPSVDVSTSSQLPSLPSASELTSVPSSATQSSSSEKSSNGFPETAIIGMGVGIPTALILGIGVGFFLFRRHKKSSNIATSTTPMSHGDHQHHGGGHYGSNTNEAAMKSPAELGYHGDTYGMYHNRQAKQDGNTDDGTVRYEM